MSYSDDWPRPPRRRPRTLWSDLAALWDWLRTRPLVARLVAGTVAVVLVLLVVSRFGGPEGETKVAARVTTTLRSIPVITTTSTTIVLPAGDDTVVRTVLDGDSFELLDGTKIRLIGIDAPDVETDDCYSAEATGRLRDLLPGGRSVRVVYDTNRTDRFGRTLAYVYRLPDGLFVNVALAREGVAIASEVPPNTLHAAAIAAAADEAKAGGRGLHQACASTTTAAAARPSTTAAPAGPTTTAAPVTTTTEAPATTTTAAPATTTTTRNIVQVGFPCDPPGAKGYFATGVEAKCAPAGNGLNEWRAA